MSVAVPASEAMHRVNRREDLLTTGDIARRCRVTTNAVKKWIRERNLPAFRTPGGHFRIRAGDYDAFAARCRVDFPGPRPTKGRRVLVVDDDPAVLGLVVEGLSACGMGLTVAGASDGYEALIAIGRFRPDILVLDLRMPRLDGLEVCRLLKSSAATRDIAILVLTGYPSRTNVRRWRQCRVDAILGKPVRLDVLVREVRTLVDALPASRPGAEARRSPSRAPAGAGEARRRLAQTSAGEGAR